MLRKATVLGSLPLNTRLAIPRAGPCCMPAASQSKGEKTHHGGPSGKNPPCVSRGKGTGPPSWRSATAVRHTLISVLCGCVRRDSEGVLYSCAPSQRTIRSSPVVSHTTCGKPSERVATNQGRRFDLGPITLSVRDVVYWDYLFAETGEVSPCQSHLHGGARSDSPGS